MQSLVGFENLETLDAEETIAPSASDGILDRTAISTASFVESCFIPNHVALKTRAGRAHFQAILKHVLRPETVDRLFFPYQGESRSRLRSIPEWPYLDETRLCDINSDHVRRLTSLAVNRGYSSQTVRHIKNVISAIIAHAKREHFYTGDNPITEVRLPPVERRTTPSVSLVEARAIFRMMGYPERQIALMVFNSTMNVSEICGLRWKYVNPTLRASYVEGDIVPARSILVKHQRTPSGLMLLSPERIRVVEISAALLELLDALKPQRHRQEADDFLFPKRSGIPICPKSIQVSKLKPIGRRLGIQFSWHTLKELHSVFLQDLQSRLNSELAAL
jgi:integrase